MRWKQSVVSFASRDHPALIAAARHGLPGLPAFDGPPATIDANDAEPIRIFARTDRISGLLAGAVRSGEVVFTSDADAHLESIDDDWHTALHACVLIEALLVRLADRLAPTRVRWSRTRRSTSRAPPTWPAGSRPIRRCATPTRSAPPR